MAILIGYQGVELSFNFNATEKFISSAFDDDIEITMVPLINSSNVVNALIKRKIQYGVMAISNNTCGDVIETTKALEKFNGKYSLVGKLYMPIHHCIFTIDKNVNIHSFASHPQALSQTIRTREKNFKEFNEISIEDTALGCKMLLSGELDSSTAIICSYDAGKYYNLHLVKKNVEDTPGNTTLFGLYKIL